MADAQPTPRFRPLAVGLAAAAAVAAVLVPLAPDTVRPLNFAVFGAVAVFAAARGGRMGWAAGLGLALAAKLASDLLNYANHGYHTDYLPIGAVYLGFAGYALAGWLGRSAGVGGVVGAAVGGSVLFFLVTNFHSWLRQDLPYGYTLGGLAECYTMGVPFYRATFLGDVGFTAVLLGLNAALEAVAKPAAVRVEHTSRG